MNVQAIAARNLTDNLFFTLPDIGNPALGEVTVTIYRLTLYQGVWSAEAGIAYTPAIDENNNKNITHITYFNAEAEGLVRIIRMQGAPVTVWFPKGAGVQVLQIPGMHKLCIEAGYHA